MDFSDRERPIILFLGLAIIFDVELLEKGAISAISNAILQNVG